MITNTHLISLGFTLVGKEKHLALKHGDNRKLIIRGTRLFLMDRYDLSCYEKDYDLRLHAIWEKCTSLPIAKLSIHKLNSLIKAIIQGQWLNLK